MAKQNPDLLLLKMGDGATSEVFSTLCGLTTRNLTLDGAAVDVTTIACDGSGDPAWREMAQGVRQMSFSGSGYFQTKTQSVALIEAKMDGSGIKNFQVIVPGLGTFQGPFMIGSVGVSAEVGGGAVAQSLELSSSGKITFTEEV